MIRSRTLFDGSKGFVLFSEEHKKSNPFSYRKKVRILLLWCTISGRVKNSVRSACRPVRPPFCFAKSLVRLYAARGVHCSLPTFAHAQSWPLLTNPQPFLATSPRETNTSACAKCESVLKGMVQQKTATFVAAIFGAPSVGALRKCSCGAFLATSPRETNTSACAKCESVPKGMVQQKSRNICCGFFWCTIGDSPAL